MNFHSFKARKSFLALLGIMFLLLFFSWPAVSVYYDLTGQNALIRGMAVVNRYNHTTITSGTTGAAQANNSSSVTGVLVDLSAGSYQEADLSGTTDTSNSNTGVSIFFYNPPSFPQETTVMIKAGGTTPYPLLGNDIISSYPAFESYDSGQFPFAKTAMGTNKVYELKLRSYGFSGSTIYAVSGVTLTDA